MSTCWKCGQNLSEGQVECENGCGAEFPTDAQVDEALRRIRANTADVDWSKVQTVEDMREILSVLFGSRIHFPLGIPQRIKRFLIPPQEGK
jgi:hypothetical protein